MITSITKQKVKDVVIQMNVDVPTFICSDGKEFEVKDKAEKWEKILNLKDKIKEIPLRKI